LSVPSIATGSLIDAAFRAPRVSIETLTFGGNVLVLAPHPDDETFGCGQAIAAACAAGHRVTLLLLTDGENSHPGSRRFGAQARCDLRREELERSLSQLAPGRPIPVSSLGLEDGSTEPAQLAPATIRTVCDICEREHIAVIWTTWGGDPHCDHQTAASLAALAAQRADIGLYSFPVWGRFEQVDPIPDLLVFDDPEARRAKGRAARQFRSQLGEIINDDPEGFVMPTALLDHFIEHEEIFIRER
jgi:LmbE family N-acetylglucosaminyl deacetylase